MNESILTIVSSGFLSAGMVFLARNWISQRIKSAIEHEYAVKLEAYTAQLKSEHELALEKLKTNNAQVQAIQTTATASFAASHAASQEKRLQALETVWAAALQLRTGAPSILTLLDVLLPEEYDELLTNQKLKPELDKLTEDCLMPVSGAELLAVDKARLYAGEYLFALFSAYLAITGRIAFKLLDGRRKGKIDDWASDPGIHQLFHYAFTPDEVAEFEKLQSVKLKWFRNRIEQTILNYSAKIISGEASSEDSLEQAKKIMAATANLNAANKP
jgi:hypothetical protein